MRMTPTAAVLRCGRPVLVRLAQACKVEPHLASGRLVEGTMMGHQCLRTARTNGFVATIERATGNVVLKLSKARVAEMVEAGTGVSFAPAGKVFREWLAVTEADEHFWRSLLREGVAFVGD